MLEAAEPSGLPESMIEHTTPAAGARGVSRLLLALLLGAVAVVGIGAGVLVFDLTRSGAPPAPIGGPAATWAAGARPAPPFVLRDQDGARVSLASLRGRPVIVTFIDPLCRNYCPLEARVLNTVVQRLPAGERPAIVAVSVDRWGDARSNLLLDGRRWHLVPEWRWGVGSGPALASVWRDYSIGVLDSPKTIAGVTVHEISHTEASYLVDAKGDERALFVWPFTADDLLATVRAMRASAGP